jgi:hypothetical protein
MVFVVLMFELIFSRNKHPFKIQSWVGWATPAFVTVEYLLDTIYLSNEMVHP